MKIREQNTAIRGLTRGKTPRRALAARERGGEGGGGGGGGGGRRRKKDVRLDCY